MRKHMACQAWRLRQQRERIWLQAHWCRNRNKPRKRQAATILARNNLLPSNRKRGENEKVKQIREQQVPGKDAHDALPPQMNTTRKNSDRSPGTRKAAQPAHGRGEPKTGPRPFQRKGHRVHHLEKPRLRVTICRNHFVVEESFQKVANQKTKLTSVPAPRPPASGLALRVTEREIPAAGAGERMGRAQSPWFSVKENHSSRSLPDRSNCETALNIPTLMAHQRATDFVSSCWTSCAKRCSRFLSCMSPVSSEGLASARIFPFAITTTRLQICSTTSRTCEM